MGKTGARMDETLAEIGQNFPRVALTLAQNGVTWAKNGLNFGQKLVKLQPRMG